ncbi:AlbA family DNA-binding domain-containing protein [Photobacterium kagoshimensis]|uniref:AlbA family DNA-binding domain-containing protein n=1 Tax=Photobacterium kagoshimensis TaxID=2910242 RepID=UPI003D0C277C
MLNNDEIALSKLKEQERFLASSNHPYTYYIWQITEDLSNSQFKDAMFRLSHNYSKTHQLLIEAKEYIEGDPRVVFPDELQQKINHMSKLAKAVWIDKDKASLKSFISIASTLKADKNAIPYYIKVVDALKKIAKVFQYNEIESNNVKLTSKMACDLSARADMSNVLTLQKIDNLDISEYSESYKRIKSLCKVGENSEIEFKSSLIYDVKNDKKDRALSKACFKNIVAFLNSNGGTLLIGIDDDGKVLGLDHEIEHYHSNSVDKFKLYFCDLFKNKIGSAYSALVNWEIFSIDGKLVMEVRCSKSNAPCYLLRKENKDFYIRINPATHCLNEEERDCYIRERFPN